LRTCLGIYYVVTLGDVFSQEITPVLY